MSRTTSNPRSRARRGTAVLGALLAAATVAACKHNDYLGRRDTITLGAGDAMAHNQAVHTTDPWPPYSADRQLTHDGKRILLGVQRYQENKSIEPRGLATTDNLTVGEEGSATQGQQPAAAGGR